MGALSIDVAIVGGGIVGCVLATALARGGASVAVIEAREISSAPPDPFAERPIALSAASVRVLDTLGIWGRLESSATPIRRIHVSDRGHPGFARIDAARFAVDALGHVVSASRIARESAEVLAAAPGVDVLRPARVEGVEAVGECARIAVQTGGARRSLGAGIVVAADGSSSPVARMLGLRATRHDYGQHALVASVETTRAHEGTAYERFTADGPMALLPMGGNRSGLIWTCRPESAEALAALEAEVFLERLQRTFGSRLGGFVDVGPRAVHPLVSVRMRQQVAARAVVVGNAAHTLHPVAGQGLNLGVRDVAVLAERLTAALRDGLDPGAPDLLEAYQRARRADQGLVCAVTDGLVHLFSNRLPGLGLLRAAGLLAFDVVGPAKDRFARRAMGLGSRQSRLARGLAP